MAEPEGRSPHPKGGDPTVKSVSLQLTPEEWRRLRAWAAHDARSEQAIIAEIVRRELARRPRSTF
jgi:hypothetical protein